MNTDQATDLSWVTFTEETHEIPCDSETIRCPNVAACVSFWLPNNECHNGCTCGSKKINYCVSCTEKTLHMIRKQGHYVFLCTVCHRETEMIDILPLQR